MSKLLSDAEVAEFESYYNPESSPGRTMKRLLTDRTLLMDIAKAAEWVNRQAGNEHAWTKLQEALRAAGLL